MLVDSFLLIEMAVDAEETWAMASFAFKQVNFLVINLDELVPLLNFE